MRLGTKLIKTELECDDVRNEQRQHPENIQKVLVLSMFFGITILGLQFNKLKIFSLYIINSSLLRSWFLYLLHQAFLQAECTEAAC